MWVGLGDLLQTNFFEMALTKCGNSFLKSNCREELLKRKVYKENRKNRKAKLIDAEYLMQPDFKKIL